MSEEDFERFASDQERVAADVRRGLDAYAAVPLRFNRNHPHYPGEEFLPLLVLRGEKHTDPDGSVTREMTFLYIKVDLIVPAMSARDDLLARRDLASALTGYSPPAP